MSTIETWRVPSDRWAILNRDNFTCAYCGCRPGSGSLHVDHIIPRCQGGSDHRNNLVTACDRCNGAKNGAMGVPSSMCEPEKDDDGWVTWKRFGRWKLKWNPASDSDHNVVLSIGGGLAEYWIGCNEFHDDDLIDHVSEKTWCEGQTLTDFIDAMDFAKSVTRRDD